MQQGGTDLKKILPIIGEKYGRMIILKIMPDKITKAGRKERVVLCKCTCGNIKEVLFRGLRSGTIKSCGCYAREQTSLSNREYNKYYIDGEVTKVFDNKGNFTLIDTEDLEKVKPYYFMKTVKGYWGTCHNNIKLHRLITDCPEGMVVDHINHDKTDNRKCNLRICTVGQNNMNNKSNGYSFDIQSQKWKVYCNKDYNRYYGGSFDTEEEAKKVSKELRLEIFGEFAFK